MTFEEYIHGGRLEAAGIPPAETVYENEWDGEVNYVVTSEDDQEFFIYKIENGEAEKLETGADPAALLKKYMTSK